MVNERGGRTNPTALHYETLKQLDEFGRKFFIEKPLFDRPDLSLTALNLSKEKIYYVACPIRYKKIYRLAKKLLHGQKVYNVRAICSSYLPDWRPQADYRQSYSAHKDKGGGVDLDLIHEWVKNALCIPQGVQTQR